MTPAGKLTTHVLDTARGRPAEGMAVELFRQGERLKAEERFGSGDLLRRLVHLPDLVQPLL